MDYSIEFAEEAIRTFDKWVKKYGKSFYERDFKSAVAPLKKNPPTGVSMGKNMYKIRVSISAKNKGKSGGGRIIYAFRNDINTIFIMCLYDKSCIASLSKKALDTLSVLATKYLFRET